MIRKIALFFFIFLSLGEAYEQTRYYDVVLDLDWTAVYGLRPGEPIPAGAVEADGRHYMPTPGLENMIETLLRKYPNVRISFFSGGLRIRNEELLSKIFLSDGRSLKDIAFRNLSFDDLTELSKDPQLRFFDRYQKRPQDFIPEANLSRLILIDDHPEFRTKGMQVLYSYGYLHYREEWRPDMIVKGTYEASTRQEWLLEHNKAWGWLGLIEEAIRRDKTNPGSFTEFFKPYEKEQRINSFAPWIHRARCESVF